MYMNFLYKCKVIYTSEIIDYYSVILMMFKEFITLVGTKDLNETSDFYQNILELTIYMDQRVCLIFNLNYRKA